MKKIILLILDGFGIRESENGNAIKMASLPNLARIMSDYPVCELEASGEVVGLPKGQSGNSEACHMTIGCGRTVEQPLTLINNKIKDKSFFENDVLLDLMDFVNDNNLRIDYEYLEDYMYNKLNFRYIDIFNTLELDDYYKTDSHFMINKIDKVASRLLSGMNNYNDISYDVEKVSTFDGVYKSRVPVSTSTDELNIIKNDGINNSLIYDYSKNSYISFYDLNKLKSNDKYEMYLGGSTPLVNISNDLSDNDRELIIFRDSFGSSLAPLLVSSYKTITLADTRYISPKILGNYIDFNNKDVLFIYNTSIINNSYGLK